MWRRSAGRPETIHWHCKCLALTFCVLCLILVLRGILYTGRFHPGDRIIHPPDSLMGEIQYHGTLALPHWFVYSYNRGLYLTGLQDPFWVPCVTITALNLFTFNGWLVIESNWIEPNIPDPNVNLWSLFFQCSLFCFVSMLKDSAGCQPVAEAYTQKMGTRVGCAGWVRGLVFRKLFLLNLGLFLCIFRLLQQGLIHFWVGGVTRNSPK